MFLFGSPLVCQVRVRFCFSGLVIALICFNAFTLLLGWLAVVCNVDIHASINIARKKTVSFICQELLLYCFSTQWLPRYPTPCRKEILVYSVIMKLISGPLFQTPILANLPLFCHGMSFITSVVSLVHPSQV